MRKGLFLTFEGNEGCGKTTVTNQLKNKLESAGYEVVYTREPGGIEISEKIREIILDPNNDKMDDRTEALLYAAARRQHLVEKVKPAIEKGAIVLCDRFVDSSLAYQGVGRNLGIKEVMEINEFAIEGFMPDKTFLLEIDVELGMKRAKKRSALDRLEKEDLDFHLKVAEGYKKIKEMYSNRICSIDANRELNTIVDDVYNQIIGLLND